MKDIQAALAVLIFGTAAVVLGIGACKGVPTVGGSETSIVLYANPTAVAIGGSSAITVSAFQASGQPMPDGTQITLSASSGSIDPTTVATTGGYGHATFRAGSSPGTVSLGAASGSAPPASLVLTVGGNAVTLVLSATPSALPAGGGTVAIVALARDASGQPAAGIPVSFETSEGTLASGGLRITTGSDGVAADTLSTSLDCVVTARAYSVAGSGGSGSTGATGPSGPTGGGGSTVTATASRAIDVAGIGAAKLTVTATPQQLGPGGGTSAISVLAQDAAGAAVAGLAVVFSTNAGALQQLGTIYTSASGIANNSLATNLQATVTASAPGVASSSTTIRVGNPTPSSLAVSLVVSPSSVTLPISPPQSVAACSRLGSSFDVTLTATVTASGDAVPGALVVFYAQAPAAGARQAGAFCESPPQAITDANGIASVHWGLTSSEISACEAIAVPCPGAVCPTPVACPTPATVPTPGLVNDCCCGETFTAQVGNARDTEVFRILTQRDCTLAPPGNNVCACTF